MFNDEYNYIIRLRNVSIFRLLLQNLFKYFKKKQTQENFSICYGVDLANKGRVFVEY